MSTIAIDFGNTHTVIARWHDLTDQAEILTISNLSENHLIPSALYRLSAQKCLIGQSAQAIANPQESYYCQIKRHVTSGSNYRSGEYLQILDIFWQVLLQNIQANYPSTKALILTAPVQANENYLRAIEQTCKQMDIEDIQWLDEPTAAAIGYGQKADQNIVLVVDWGGGTLDISLVKLRAPEPALVLAKTGQTIGGMDIDFFLLKEFLTTQPHLQEFNRLLLPLFEKLKIELSTQETASTFFYHPHSPEVVELKLTRSHLIQTLTNQRVYQLLEHSLQELVERAHHRGLLKVDIKHILMTGGTTRLPLVRQCLTKTFPWAHIHSDRPFTAVVEGAIALAQTQGIRDYLFHDYAIRYWHENQQDWAYHPIFHKGQPYPTHPPQTVTLRATSNQQREIEVMIGELEQRSANATEISLQQGQLVAVVSGKPQAHFTPLHRGTIATLDPPAQLGHDRLKLEFQVSSRRELILSITDLLTGKLLLNRQIVAKLR